MNVSAKKNLSIIFCSLLCIAMAFQNCGSDVGFDGNETLSKASSVDQEGASQDTLDMEAAPIMETEIAPTSSINSIKDSLALNSACDDLGKTFKLDGESNFGDLRLSGVQDAINIPLSESIKISGLVKGNISILKSKSVTISGRSDNVFVHDAKELRITGVHKDICVRTNDLRALAGNHGSIKGQIAVVGNNSESRASGQTISGLSNADITIVDIDIRSITGAKKNVYVSGSTIQYITGVTGDIHLFNGAVVEKISGRVGNIHLHDGSMIKTLTGVKGKIITHK